MANSKTQCAFPQNQSIYQALLDKAATYPPDKPYQANAYRKAAVTILSYQRNIYNEFAKYGEFLGHLPNIGESIAEFIYTFIEDTIAKNQTPLDKMRELNQQHLDICNAAIKKLQDSIIQQEAILQEIRHIINVPKSI